MYWDFDMRPIHAAWLCVSIWTCALACAITTYACVAAAAAQPPESQSDSQHPLQEVTVTAARVQDHRTLERAINSFVASHSAPSYRINQIGRWHEPVCPVVTGLEAGGDFITQEILEVARDVGAPTGAVGKKCAVTVEIVFTPEPQALLNRMAKEYRPLLGFFPVSQHTQMTTFSRPIQAWYETGTRSMEIQFAQIPDPRAVPPPLSIEAMPSTGGETPLLPGAQIDSDETAGGFQPSGVAGSRLTGRRVRSEFIHVLIIVDSGQVVRYPLVSVADYLAMLSLSRMAQLDQCAPLPSITDLLASGCAAPAANSLTAADRAYLKALYSADLEQSVNMERAEVRGQMMRQIGGK
jgi:hypothetical protein